jgi:uncharacterized protein YndB with AHSA1/START domain
MKTIYTKDASNKKMIVMREFAAPIEKVWQAWTDRNILDTWWAPKPFIARTKSQDFREGGMWLYCMVGPKGEEFWCRADYTKVVALKRFDIIDTFCDADGKATGDLPQMSWTCEFSKSDAGTTVHIEINFASEEDMAKIMEMGFQEGFTAAHGNLDEYFLA